MGSQRIRHDLQTKQMILGACVCALTHSRPTLQPHGLLGTRYLISQSLYSYLKNEDNDTDLKGLY